MSQLEKELELREKEKEKVLNLRQLKLKEAEKQNKGSKASYAFGLLEQMTEEELSALMGAKQGFS